MRCDETLRVIIVIVLYSSRYRLERFDSDGHDEIECYLESLHSRAFIHT
jgi:hypothetical protein